ncbi:hypothetical protein GGS20DRAFT_399389 [Poronia punctata]|nr:hypothetical protein GGS20DRAFT_399389 [Poronia punctata]
MAPELKKEWDELMKSHGYVLGRARRHAAAGRLNLQHYLWKAAFGHTNIRPAIAANLPAAPVVADVATGTCLWLLDTARELGPDAQFDGLDYNLEQAPHPSTLPPNMRTRYWDVHEPPPEDLVGRYDYVHLRLVVLVVRDEDPRPIARNLFKLLKPGGYIQWDEIDVVHKGVKKADPSQQTPGLDGLVEWFGSQNPYLWTVRLAEFLADVGFTETKTELISDPPGYERAFNELHLLTAEELADSIAKLGDPKVAAKYYDMIEKANEESAEGAVVYLPRLVCTGRKPA